MSNQAPRLKNDYNKKVKAELKKQFNYANDMEIPRITKITLNMDVGKAAQDKKIAQNAATNLTDIAGQKAVITNVKKSVAGFKIRDGWPIGCKVTLRADRMYEFLDRFINIALPRTRDFRGVNPKSF